jgi:hypothetical protein
MEQSLLNSKTVLDVEELQAELENFKGNSVTVHVINGCGTVLCMSGFNSGISTNCNNEDLFEFQDDDSLNIDFNVSDIEETYKDFMGVIYIILKNQQVIQIESEEHGIFNYANEGEEHE